MAEKKFVDPRFAKNKDYARVMADIQKGEVCPFCPDVFPGKWHTNPILNTMDNWLITRNMYPYPGSQEHFLIVGNQHKENLVELIPEDLVAILKLAQWATVEFSLPGGLLAFRFGDSEHTGATVKHLHAHLVVPGKENGRIQVVNFPVG